MSIPAPLVVINAVGLTSRWLAHANRLRKLAQAGWVLPLDEAIPAVTCTAQATMLTGVPPSMHGIVANGWLFRDTREVRFWQQSSALLQRPPVYQTLREEWSRRNVEFKVAKLFWWFNQGADVAFSLTPKPYYGADGSKSFAVSSQPQSLAATLERAIGPFPFPSFWGPRSGLASTAWIANCAAETLRRERPHLTFVYLPHLDYDPQRHGPSGCDMPRLIGELDEACAPLLDEALKQGARVWVVSEYGHCDVSTPIEINRVLRRAHWLEVRDGPFGESLETFSSRAFAVCDHQLAHVYVKEARDVPDVADLLRATPGIDRVFAGPERADLGLDHPRSGEIVALSDVTSWFAYPYWIDDARAPDFARTVDIHRKPGFDPCELFLDPALRWAKGRVLKRLLQKKLGFRVLFDVIPLDSTLVRGSHGRAAGQGDDKPIWIGDGPAPVGQAGSPIPMTNVSEAIRSALSLG